MSYRIRSLLVIAITMAACDDRSDAIEAAETDTAVTPEQPEPETETTPSAETAADTGEDTSLELDFQPTAGDWVVQESTILADECGLTDLVDRGEPGTILILEILSEADFEMTYTTGGEIVSCDLDAQSQAYNCEPFESIDETPSSLGLSASIPVVLTSTGQFSAEDEMTLTSTIELSCTGDDCFWVEQLLGTAFPCETTMQSQVTAE